MILWMLLLGIALVLACAAWRTNKAEVNAIAIGLYIAALLGLAHWAVGFYVKLP